jgi:protein TonB
MDNQQLPDQVFDRADASRPHDAPRRHGLAFIASIAAHAMILVALVFLLPEIERPHHDWVLAYLVEFDQPGAVGKGAGASDARASSSPAPAHAEASVAMPPKPLHAHRSAARTQAKPAPRAPRPDAEIAATPVPGDAAISAGREPIAPAAPGTIGALTEVASAAPTRPDGGGGGGRGGAEAGDGSGASFAHVEYSQNPVPVYPIGARLRAQQGTVILRVEVGADGSVERAEVAKSSGFDSLDQSAMETVRTRWRFVPARRDGVPVESWCEIPIRFALTEAQAN